MKGDVADQAQDQIDAFNDQAVARARRAAKTVSTHPGFNGKDCVDCGIEIPEARLAFGKYRCVDCQTDFESMRARR